MSRVLSMLTMLFAAVAAGGAAILGAILPRWRRPSTLVSSVILGFAAGVMTGTVAFEIVPESLRLAHLVVVSLGFAAGFGLVYGLDLFIHRGEVAGENASQRKDVEAAQSRKRPLGGPALVLAGGSLFEAAIEGLSLGVGSAIGAGLTLPLALAVAIDNVSEGMSLETLGEGDEGNGGTEALHWTIWIAATTVIAALAGWFLLRTLPPAVHAAIFAAGGGAMLYLTVTELIPKADAVEYQRSSALAAALGFLAILILSESL